MRLFAKKPVDTASPETIEVASPFSLLPEPLKLHLACGKVHLDGWTNVDLDPVSSIVDISWDLRNPLPIPPGTVSFIYHEHFLEHLSVPEGLAFLRECHRLLGKDGVMRIATPSLRYAAEKYLSEDWKSQTWLTWEPHSRIQTACEALNIGMRSWGHQWVYDEIEIERRLREAGFTGIEFCSLGQSSHPDLRNLETREDSKLIAEAWKA